MTLRVLGEEAPLARAAAEAEAAAGSEVASPAAAAQAPGADGAAAGASAAVGSRTAFNLPMASLEGKPGVAGRLWATFLPLGEPGPDGSAPKGISSECGPWLCDPGRGTR